ncbi:OmpA family protein [Rhodoferax sp. AJA081-3]|uniref:OmpA family protein n=1 Tax=Rhodoferax sp. AJA081-3 TaxID=2752316 RepID=UPI001ADF4E52|nr:OmpA family protein [Rhodoferax sp. AJA081-3]QTN27570.1 OmpA family protein [Rhodoferax sp. AJA081-3]
MSRNQLPAPVVKLACAALLASLLSACAGPQSYVALVPSPDGSLGKVSVQGQRGDQLLTRAKQGALLDGSKPPFDVSDEQLQRDFGAAMRARPVLPEQFLLYFETGGSELTAESKALLQRVVQSALARASVDMSVIGHSDTQGAADANEALALARATAIAEQLRGMGLANTAMAIESHGERNLLVPTPDETAEPRNRRVEITLR